MYLAKISYLLVLITSFYSLNSAIAAPVEPMPVDNKSALHNHQEMCSAVGPEKNNNTWKMAAAGVSLPISLSLVLGYKKNKKFRAFVDRLCGQVKMSLLHNIALPLATKYDEIKTQGVTKKDSARGACALAAGYCFVKMCSYLELMHALKTREVSKTLAALKKAWYYAKEHKTACIGAGVVGGLLVLLWKKFDVVAEKAKHSYLLDKLFHSFSTDQHIALIESDELQSLIAQAHSDPQPLKHHEEFKTLLTDEQKELLAQALEAHEGSVSTTRQAE